VQGAGAPSFQPEILERQLGLIALRMGHQKSRLSGFLLARVCRLRFPELEFGITEQIKSKTKFLFKSVV
jgi:hypothetical protein